LKFSLGEESGIANGMAEFGEGNHMVSWSMRLKKPGINADRDTDGLDGDDIIMHNFPRDFRLKISHRTV